MTSTESFDFIVIGAGAAGCVLAYRLATESDATVLVLESGPADDEPLIRQPYAWVRLLGSDVDWKYVTTPQQGAAGRSVPWPRGRVVGGSTSINAMVYMRGHAQDYDSWSAMGNPGWSYLEVLDAFKAIESFPDGDPVYRGADGPLRVRRATATSELAQAVFSGAVEWGAPVNEDFNGESLDGVGWNQLTISDHLRQSAADAFLRPALATGRITLRTQAHVTDLELGKSGRVEAVRYLRDGATHTCRVGQEVFLAAGTIESPKLLMLAGIGPAAQLREHGIPVTIPLDGVGANLHDHPGVPVVVESRKAVPFGSNQGSELGLFCRTQPAVRVPDLQFGLLNLAIASDPAALRSQQAFTFSPSLLKPRSRGSIRLASPSPLSHPRVDPAYLADDADVEALVRAVEISRELAATRALEPWTRVEMVPGPDCTGADLRRYVRESVNTWFHPVGTCRMGQDELAVVDARLRVRGAENLRVVDASVIPEVTSGNTAAPTMMIAWRAAGFALAR